MLSGSMLAKSDTMKPSRTLFAEMTRQELRAIAGETTVVLPLGATEQHGPHLPAGTHFFTLAHLAPAPPERAATDIPTTLTPRLPFAPAAPPLPFVPTLSHLPPTHHPAPPPLP